MANLYNRRIYILVSTVYKCDRCYVCTYGNYDILSKDLVKYRITKIENKFYILLFFIRIISNLLLFKFKAYNSCNLQKNGDMKK